MKKQGSIRFFLSILMLSAFVPSTLKGQTVIQTPERYYGRGRVIIKGGERFEAIRLLFKDGKLTFDVKSTGEERVYDLSQVDFASRYKGYAMEGAIAGGSLMLLAGLSAVLQVKADPNLELKENAGLIIAGLTVGGTLVGALIGSAFKREKTIFQNGRFIVKLGFRPAIHGSAMETGLGFAHLQMSF